jgi:hypothetical protein
MKQIIKKQYLILILFATNIVNSQTTPLNPVFEYFNVGQSFTSIAVEKDSLKLGQVWAGTAKKGLFNKSSASGTGVATFDWTKKLSPFALTLRNENTKTKLQFRI